MAGAAAALGRMNVPSLPAMFHRSPPVCMQTFEDRKMDISRLLNIADEFPDVPNSLLSDLAPSQAPMHHRRAASCTVPQRSSADESIMMQVCMSTQQPV